MRSYKTIFCTILHVVCSCLASLITSVYVYSMRVVQMPADTCPSHIYFHFFLRGYISLRAVIIWTSFHSVVVKIKSPACKTLSQYPGLCKQVLLFFNWYNFIITDVGPILSYKSHAERKWFLDEKRDGLVDENRINNQQKEKQQNVYTPKNSFCRSNLFQTINNQLIYTYVLVTNINHLYSILML